MNERNRPQIISSLLSMSAMVSASAPLPWFTPSPDLENYEGRPKRTGRHTKRYADGRQKRRRWKAGAAAHRLAVEAVASRMYRPGQGWSNS